MENLTKSKLKIAKELVIQNARDALISIPGVCKTEDVKVGFDKDTEEFIVDIFVIVKFGEKIPALSWDIQNAVKDSIYNGLNNVTDIKVKKINIHITGVK